MPTQLAVAQSRAKIARTFALPQQKGSSFIVIELEIKTTGASVWLRLAVRRATATAFGHRMLKSSV